MKQFKTIFSFEYLGYFKNKALIVLTVIIVAGMGILLFSPRFTKKSAGVDIDSMVSYAQKIALKAECDANVEAISDSISKSLAGTLVEITDKSDSELRAAVDSDEYDIAIILTKPLEYTYMVKNMGFADVTGMSISDAVISVYQNEALTKAGLSAEEADAILNCNVTVNTQITGKDNNQSFFYTYILMFLLYFAVIVYGQFVAQSVALEKSSRAMELLITSAKPVNLMFGKILGAGAAGLTQLVIILGSAVGFYTVNKEYWQDNMIVSSIFGMPTNLIVYTVVFFVLGFMLYSFMYGALASLASKLEDVNTLTMPVTFLMVITFMVTIFSMTGNADGNAVKVASFIPFSSPMAMFTRIAMGNVENYEIAISIALLVLTTVLIGYIAAAIYKIGVLMYGKPPKLNELFRALANNKIKK